MKKLLFLLTIFMMFGACFAQTPFDDYCMKQCTMSISEDKCNSLCILTGGAFQSSCKTICLGNNMSEMTCYVGCGLAENKRNGIEGCYGDCIKVNSTAVCEQSCNITSYIVMMKTALNEKGLETVKAVISQKIGAISTNAVAITSENKAVEVGTNPLEIKGTGETLTVEIPVSLGTGETLKSLSDPSSGLTITGNEIKMLVKDETGATTATIVAETSGVIGKEGIGEAAISKIEMRVNEISGSIKNDIENGKAVVLSKANEAGYTKPKISIDVDLKTIPLNASIKMKEANLTDENIKKFNEIAGKDNLTILGKGVVVEVTKKNIRNLDHVNKAKIRIKMDKNWVENAGGISKVRILREDEGKYEILNTVFIGEENGQLVFEGESSGLSVYALVTVEYMEPGQTTAVIPPRMDIIPIIAGIVAIVVVGIGGFFFLSKKQTTKETTYKEKRRKK